MKFQSYIFIALNFIDALTTFYGIAFLGRYEYNPIMAFFIDKGWLFFFMAKVFGVLYFFFMQSKQKFPKLKRYTYYFVNGILLLVVISNCYHLIF